MNSGLQSKAINLRLVVVCLAAGSVGLSMALISISKLLLIVCALLVILFFGRDSGAVKRQPFPGLISPAVILAVLFTFALSLLWTTAPADDAFGSVGKYGKLLLIALMILLIRSRREAIVALSAFAATQTFLLASSWLLLAGLPVPWATSNMASTEYAVFSSYLDQGIITAAFAGICWHLRTLIRGRLGQGLAIFVAAAAIANVLFVLSGRSGHAVAIVLLSLAIMWQLPGRYRALVLLLPFALVTVLFFSSAKVSARLSSMKAEVQSYSSQGQPESSSGTRLELWLASVEMIKRHPVAGSGVGSWRTEYNVVKRESNPAYQNVGGHFNPHQEYLLWAVQLGGSGVLLFLALMLSIWRDSWRMPVPVARAVQSTLAAFAVACLFNSSLYDALIGDFFCVSLGLLLALGARDVNPPMPGAAQTGESA